MMEPGVTHKPHSAVCKGGPYSGRPLVHHGKSFVIWFRDGRQCGGNPNSTERTGKMEGITRGQYRFVGEFWFWEAAK